MADCGVYITNMFRIKILLNEALGDPQTRFRPHLASIQEFCHGLHINRASAPLGQDILGW